MKRKTFFKHRQRQLKFGDYMLDIAKYTSTTILVSTFFKDQFNMTGENTLIAVVLILITLSIGLTLHTDEPIKKKK